MPLLASPWETAIPADLRGQPKAAVPTADVSWKKSLAARMLSASGLTRPLGSRLCPPSQDVRILAYHRVWDIADEAWFPFDAELVSASTEEFAWQMAWLRRHFDPITFRQWGAALDGGEPLPARPVIVTFDDGFEDNFTNAFPILRDAGIPATIFLSTDYIGAAETYWYDRLSHLVLTTSLKLVDVPWLKEPLQLGTTTLERRGAIKHLLSVLKRVPNDLRLEALDHFERELSDRATSEATRDSRPMTWDQVREMADAGIEFGSHTCSHPILANLSDEDLEHELVDSRRTIQRELGMTVETISYPVGGKTAVNDRVIAAVRNAGYRFGAVYLPGINLRQKLDPLRLRRLRVERYVTRPQFQAMLQLPNWFG